MLNEKCITVQYCILQRISPKKILNIFFPELATAAGTATVKKWEIK